MDLVLFRGFGSTDFATVQVSAAGFMSGNAVSRRSTPADAKKGTTTGDRLKHLFKMPEPGARSPRNSL